MNRWISGAGDPRCAVHLVLGKSDPDNSDRYRQQSMVIVPTNTPGVKVIRPMKVFGYDDAPEGHCEIIYDNVRVPVSNLIWDWGKGFEVCFPVVIRLASTLTMHCRSFKVVLGMPFHIIVCQCGKSPLPSSPGRIHHCMRSIGAAQNALDLLLARVTDPSRKTFGKYLYEHGLSFHQSSSRFIADFRIA